MTDSHGAPGAALDMDGEDPQHGYSAQAELLFRRFLRHGRRWKAREIERDTEGEVSGAYISALLSNKIKHPGREILNKIADVMGFPPTLWRLEPQRWDAELERVREEALRSRRAAGISTDWGGEERPRAGEHRLLEEGPGGEELADLLNALFEGILNKYTGRSYTEQQVAIYAGGMLNAEDIRAMRSGHSPPATRGQLLALSDAFEVSPDYWRRGRPQGPPDAQIQQLQQFIDRETAAAGAHREISSQLSGVDLADLSEEDRSALLKFVEYLGFNARNRRREQDDESHR